MGRQFHEWLQSPIISLKAASRGDAAIRKTRHKAPPIHLLEVCEIQYPCHSSSQYQSCRLKSELIEKGNGSPHLLQAAIHQSNDITKKRFHKPVVREDSHMGLVRKAKANLNSRQMWAARELYKWRDRVSVTLERIGVIV